MASGAFGAHESLAGFGHESARCLRQRIDLGLLRLVDEGRLSPQQPRREVADLPPVLLQLVVRVRQRRSQRRDLVLQLHTRRRRRSAGA